MTTLFEEIYRSACILREAKSFNSSSSIIDAIKDGTMVKLLNGKKNLPEWLKLSIDNNKDIDEIKSCFDKILPAISYDINNGINETICLLIKKSSSLDVMKQIVAQSKDALIAYSTSIKTQWVKTIDIVNQVEAAPYNQDLWRSMEKTLQDVQAKKRAKKHKTVADKSALYDTLYEDADWGLYVPKNQEGDSELASHIEPFEDNGEIYTKTRWCTAAAKSYYNSYTESGNKLYVIKHFENGKYIDAWQIAFDDVNHVEFMNKSDIFDYDFVMDNAPDALLEKVVCDNEIDNNLTLKDFKNSGEGPINLGRFFSIALRDSWLQYKGSKPNGDLIDYLSTDFEYNYLMNRGLLLENITKDVYKRNPGKCKRYTDIVRKYNLESLKLEDFIKSSYSNNDWARYFNCISEGAIIKDITMDQFMQEGEVSAKQYSQFMTDLAGILSPSEYSIGEYCHNSSDALQYVLKFIEYRKNNKLKNITYTFAKSVYTRNIPATEIFEFLLAVDEGRCPTPAEGNTYIYGPKAYQSIRDKEGLANLASDIKNGLLPNNVPIYLYDQYDRSDVLEYFDLSQKGAFDNTATLDQFVEYGAQNLNDINILKHQKRLWPTFTIVDCFQLGSDRALAISKEMYEKNYPLTATLEDYFTFGDKLLVYQDYKNRFPGADFTKDIDTFVDAYDDEYFNDFIEFLQNSASWWQEYSYEDWKQKQDLS